MASYRVLMSKVYEVIVHDVENEDQAEDRARDMFVDDDPAVQASGLEVDAVEPVDPSGE